MSQYTHAWRCRGPGGSHRLQNGWGVARRGPWWVRLPYASAFFTFEHIENLSLIPWFCRICKTMLPISDCKTMLPSKYSKIVDICLVTEISREPVEQSRSLLK